MKILLTGIGGFIGSHCLEYFLEKTDWTIFGIDSFCHKGTYSRLNEVINRNFASTKRVKIFHHDLTVPIDQQLENQLMERSLDGRECPIDYIFNLASDSAVERSITEPGKCWKNNCELIYNVLEFARQVKPMVFMQFSCYDEETRVLTEDGFKKYNEIKIGDKVLTVNPGNISIETKSVKKVIVQDYDGEMVSFNNNVIDMLVTPNHRMYYRSKKDDNNLSVASAEEIALSADAKYIPRGCWAEGIDEDKVFVKDIGYVDTRLLFYLCGVFISNGFLAYQEKKLPNKSGYNRDDFLRECRGKDGRFEQVAKKGVKKYSKGWRIFFDVPENDKCRKRLEKTLTSLGIDFTKQKNKSGEHIYLTSKVWFNFFRQFGKHARNKNVPNWMLQFDKDYLQCLFDGLLDSDGYRRRNGKQLSYTTVSAKLLKDICEIGLKIGYCPRFSEDYSEGFLDGRKISGYAYRIWFGGKGRINRIVKKQYAEKVKYRGKIWCLSVEDNKNMLVERNGVLMFCGNTDEVYGQAEQDQAHKEWDVIMPSSVYSSSKAAQEALSISYWRTYDVPLVLVNVMNAVGEWQDKEKFLPKLIWKIATGQEMEIYGEPGRIGSRFYIHCKNIADAMIFLSEIKPAMYRDGAKRPDRYNVVGDLELDNLQVAEYVAKVMDKELKYKLIPSETARRGYDKRYALDGAKMANLGWRHPIPTLAAIDMVVKWTLDNPHWII